MKRFHLSISSEEKTEQVESILEELFLDHEKVELVIRKFEEELELGLKGENNKG
jgi:hexokinase